MSTAWDAFMRVLAEITEASREGESADDIHEFSQHAGELLDIMGEEIDNEPPDTQDALRSAVATLRKRLAALERDVRPPKH